MTPGLGRCSGEEKHRHSLIVPSSSSFFPSKATEALQTSNRSSLFLPGHSQINPTGNTPALFKQVSGHWETSLWQALGLPQCRRLQEFQSSHPSRNRLPKRNLPSAASALWAAAILPAHPLARFCLLLQPNPGSCSLSATLP